jgi:hypothetical protein
MKRITELTVTQVVKSIKDNHLLAESTKRKILMVFKTALRQILKGAADYSAILEAIKLPKTENALCRYFP